jgi:hypothetical protein
MTTRRNRGGKSTNKRIARPEPTLAACTIIARNYLSHAKILAESFFATEKDGRFYLLVVDHLPEGANIDPRIRLVDPAELSIPNYYEWCLKYDVTELCTAVKPSLFSYLVHEQQEQYLVYFDPDILVMKSLNALKNAFNDGCIVLTPHLLKPIPQDGLKPSEQDILLSGAYNLGFLGLKQSSQVTKFLNWWAQRLEDSCRIDHASGLFVDQRWIDLVPGMFSATTILRNKTYNVAYWNVHSRPIRKRGDIFLVGKEPITFFHFSGFDPSNPESFSKHQDRVMIARDSPLAELFHKYRLLHVKSGYRTSSQWNYGYSAFDDGMPVHSLLRRLYLQLDDQVRAQFGDPFSTKGPTSFREWATTPADQQGRLSPFLELVYQVRYDVAAAFPDVNGKDHEGFMTWARTSGASELGFPPHLVQQHDEAPASRGSVIAAPEVLGPADGRNKNLTPVDSKRLPRERYDQLIHRIREVVEGVVPVGATVAVVSKGDEALLQLAGRQGWHFPRTDDGTYAGYYPADSATAIAHLEAMRAAGAEYLVFPATAFWWLEHYADFRQYLDQHCQTLQTNECCRIYELHDCTRVCSGPN